MWPGGRTWTTNGLEEPAFAHWRLPSFQHDTWGQAPALSLISSVTTLGNYLTSVSAGVPISEMTIIKISPTGPSFFSWEGLPAGLGLQRGWEVEDTATYVCLVAESIGLSPSALSSNPAFISNR